MPPARRGRSVIVAFVAGFLAVLLFHQGVASVLYLAGLGQSPPYSLASTTPLGVPQVLSAAFWGGIWGLIFVFVERWFPRGTGYWVTAFLFGAFALTLVFALVVAPLKGIPTDRLAQPATVIYALLVNGAWGIGMGILLALFQSSSKGAA